MVERNVQNQFHSIFINSISWNCVQYIFTCRGAVILYALGIFEAGFKQYSKTIYSYTFLHTTYGKKVDVSYSKKSE